MKTATQKRDAAIQLCRDILADPDYFCILDTETTGLNGEPVEIAAIAPNGETLYNQRLMPKDEIHPKAQEVHGITLDSLRADNAPTWADERENFLAFTLGRTFLIYNEPFDLKIMRNADAAHGFNVSERFYPNTGICIMRMYSDFINVSKWQKLEGGDHSALGDCRAVLDLIKEMASAPLSKIPDADSLDKPAITDIVGRLDAITTQQKALKKEENDLKAIAWQTVEDNGGPVALPDGRSIQHGSNIVKLKPIVPVEELPDAFRMLSVNKKAATEAVEKQPGVLNDLFSWESSSFLKIVKAERK